jgi:hypothetical protein
MQAEGGWARIAWASGKLSKIATVDHVGRVKKQLNSEPGLKDFVAMAVHADGLGAVSFDRLIELGHSVTEIRGGQPAVEPEDFVNRLPSGTGICASGSRMVRSTSTPMTTCWQNSWSRSNGR